MERSTHWILPETMASLERFLFFYPKSFGNLMFAWTIPASNQVKVFNKQIIFRGGLFMWVFLWSGYIRLLRIFRFLLFLLFLLLGFLYMFCFSCFSASRFCFFFSVCFSCFCFSAYSNFFSCFSLFCVLAFRFCFSYATQIQGKWYQDRNEKPTW